MTQSKPEPMDRSAADAERKAIWDMATELIRQNHLPLSALKLAAKMRRQLHKVDLSVLTSKADRGSTHRDASVDRSDSTLGEAPEAPRITELLERVVAEIRLSREQSQQLSRRSWP